MSNYGRGRSQKPKMHIVVAGAGCKEYGDISYCKRWTNRLQTVSLEAAKQIGLDSKSLCAACVKRVVPRPY